MNMWMMNAVFALFALLVSTGLFFFVVTRGALVVRGLSPGSQSETSHVYPIYSNMRLIKLVDEPHVRIDRIHVRRFALRTWRQSAHNQCAPGYHKEKKARRYQKSK